MLQGMFLRQMLMNQARNAQLQNIVSRAAQWQAQQANQMQMPQDPYGTPNEANQQNSFMDMRALKNISGLWSQFKKKKGTDTQSYTPATDVRSGKAWGTPQQTYQNYMMDARNKLEK